MSRDTTIFIDVGSDIDEFIRSIDMYGSEDLLTDDAIRIFIARAVSYTSDETGADYLVSRVMDKIQQSMRAYYGSREDTSEQERKIINAWVFLADSIKNTLREHIYENGKRNNKALALKSYNKSGEICVIACERELAWESRGWDERSS